MKTLNISLDFVNENFYESQGMLYRKDEKQCSRCISSDGYFIISFKCKNYVEHRILWMLYNQQEIPENYMIDHKDCNRTNNYKENLRLATHSQNCHNSKLQINNTSGYKGISIKNNKKYRSDIKINNKRITKIFPLTEEGLELAKKWLEEKRIELHGDFRNNG